VIDPKINISSKPAFSGQVSNNADIALADSAVQTRAYELRGRIAGRAEQDWCRAENDLREPTVNKRSGQKMYATDLFSQALRETHAA
jgi:hypothetical protein